jgi:hypothetical protein
MIKKTCVTKPWRIDFLLCTAAMLPLASIVSQAQNSPEKVSLVSDAALLSTLWAPNGVNVKVVDVTGQPFKQAVAIQTATKPENFWNAQTLHDIARPVPAGADVTIRMMARSADKDLPAKVNVTWKEQATNAALHDQQFTIGNTWTAVEMKFKNPRLVRAKIELNVGWQAQTLEVANLHAEFSGGNIAEIETMQRAEEAKSPAGPRAAMTIARGSYYDKLREEFKGVGDAYFVLGATKTKRWIFSGCERQQRRNIGPIQKFEVQGQPFKRAMRITVKTKNRPVCGTSTSTPTTKPGLQGRAVAVGVLGARCQSPQKVGRRGLVPSSAP